MDHDASGFTVRAVEGLDSHGLLALHIDAEVEPIRLAIDREPVGKRPRSSLVGVPAPALPVATRAAVAITPATITRERND
jgi:hypothetical protein